MANFRQMNVESMAEIRHFSLVVYSCYNTKPHNSNTTL